MIKVNGSPLDLLEPETLRLKVYDPIQILGQPVFGIMDMRVRVQGGGYTSRIYAIRQAIAKAVVAFYAKCTLFC